MKEKFVPALAEIFLCHSADVITDSTEAFDIEGEGKS